MQNLSLQSVCKPTTVKLEDSNPFDKEKFHCQLLIDTIYLLYIHLYFITTMVKVRISTILDQFRISNNYFQSFNYFESIFKIQTTKFITEIKRVCSIYFLKKMFSTSELIYKSQYISNSVLCIFCTGTTYNWVVGKKSQQSFI
jgi:hypothetical protein